MGRIRVLAIVALVSATLVVQADVAQAAVIPVTTTADVVDGADGVTSLREAISAANSNGVADTIQLDPLSYTLSSCGLGELLYNEGADLNIEGNGATITQTCPDQRVLDKMNNTTVVTISDLTVVNTVNSGVNITGAAFRADSQLILTNVTIDGVNAGFGGSIVAFDFGDAILDLELHSVSITNNTGRAVENLNPAGVLVEGSTISGNTGSGVSLGDGTPLTVTGSTISGNGGYGISTSGQGNGVQPIVTVTNSTVANNASGGFLCLQSCRTLDVSGSFFTGNGLGAVAGGGGGLLMAMFTDNFGELQSVTIDNTTIAGNHADHDGGGLFVAASGEVDGPDSPVTTIIGSTISDNHADCTGCDGGGVAVHVGDLVIDDSTISDNTAGANGGGIEQVRVSYDVITADSAFELTNSTVSGNTAGANGGGLWSHGSTQIVDNSTISGNQAGNVGGGVEVGGTFIDARFESGDATITNSTISGNDALFGGGLGIGFPDGSSASLTNSTLTANTATSAGGGAAVGPTELLDLLHVSLVENTSPIGANLAVSGPTTISRSVIAGPLGGGLNCEPFPFGPFPLNVTSLGFSWFEDSSCDPIGTDTVDVAGDPLLGALADNGGPTSTLLPAGGSPLVGLVPAVSCGALTDQRGVARPDGAGCEPGSVEVEDPGAMIVGTPGRDTLVGTPGADEIFGLGGRDSIQGLAGDDHIEGGRGRDVLSGGSGQNTVLGGRGRDTLNAMGTGDVLEGGRGRDTLIDWVGGNTLRGGSGRDTLISFGPGTIFEGGPGRDTCIEPGFVITSC